MVHGSGFKLGSLVAIVGLDVIGHIIEIRRDKFNQPLYDIEDQEDGKMYVARGMELDASLEATHAGMRVQSKQ